jgi:hypothetical protein
MGHIVHSGATEVRNGVGTIFHAWVGPVWIRQKAHRDTLRFSCVFTSCGICGSYSAFRCIWGAKCQLIFMLRWARCGLHKKPIGTRYTQLVFLHHVGCAGRVVCSGASGARNVDAFSCSGGPDAVYIKSALGHVTPNLCFCNMWDGRVM